MLKAWGAHVTVTCSQNAERFVRDLGADHVVDYTSGPVEKPLSELEKYKTPNEQLQISMSVLNGSWCVNVSMTCPCYQDNPAPLATVDS